MAAENNDSLMVVSLDAEKAFGSIEHWYICKILEKLGLFKFKTIFNILYRNQQVSIQLNNRCDVKYNIKNGFFDQNYVINVDFHELIKKM